ncbi:type II toxin-antitoxin system VapC family toxin [Prosthecobacter sp.]|jgi:predicted nucleic acid-binding protein|uniref:type II toxin-antitoxin system VapC family toxin n=1 Tax=Prosthecobacter sp. TaxID=1965333 RepID=UPI003784FD18
MIHLDTNLLIDLVTIGSPHIAMVRKWLVDGKELAVSAIAWSEFLNGPHSKAQKDAVQAIVGGRILDFTVKEAEQASRLFHYTGRKRGSHADCMIAACAMTQGVRVATRNIADFEKFVPHGLKLLAVETVT